MTSRRNLTEDLIVSLLNADDEIASDGSDTGLDDHVSGDDVQSDMEDEILDVAVDDEEVDDEEEEEPSASSSSSLRKKDHRIILSTKKVLRGKNKHCWATSKGKKHIQTAAINIIRTNRGPTHACRNIVDPAMVFQLFITEEIVEEIVLWTNREILLRRSTNSATVTFSTTCASEIRALIGILTLTAAMKDNHLSTEEIFDSSFSGSRYVAGMSRDRFSFLVRRLRMDDKALRPHFQQEDPFIPVRKIWELFITQCKQNYTPGAHVTIDEQLLGFRERCRFRMYVPNKPNRYGIKIPMICDSGTKYMFNAMPYIGKATNTNGLPQGEFYVKELSQPIHGTSRNITCDNWFTSVPLAKSLLSEPYKLTLVGTIRSNKREIPEL